MKKEKAPALSRRRTAASVLLPVVPAAAFRGAHEEAEHPEDQPDDEQNPEDVKRWCKQTAPAEEQQQQDQDDQRNHSRFTSFPAGSEWEQPRFMSLLRKTRGRRALTGSAFAGFPCLTAFHERPPAFGLDFDAELACGGSNPSPRGLALLVAHPFHLVEASDRLTHVPGVVQRLLALLGERKPACRHAVLLRSAQARRALRYALAMCAAALHLAGLLDVAACGSLLPCRGHWPYLL